MKHVILILGLCISHLMLPAQTVFELKPDTLGQGVFYGTKLDLQGPLAVVGTGPGLLLPPRGPYVYLYEEGPTGWELRANLVAVDSSETFFTDAAISIQNDRAHIMVGDMDNDQAGTNAGAVYMFTYDMIDQTWIQQAKLTGGGFAENQALLGTSVAIEGDYAVAGAPRKDVTLSVANPNDGTAVVYRRDGGTDTWVIDTELRASDFREAANFGQAVGISGDYIIVGAPFGDTLPDGSVAGSAYIFERKSSGWEEVQRLTPSVQAPLAPVSDQFGWSVDIEGDFAIVGAYAHVIDNTNPTGMAAIFQRINDTWQEVALLIPSDEIASGAFGWDVSIDGNGNAAVAAFSSTDGSSAYVFKKEGNNWIEQGPKINILSGGTSAVAIDGDDLLFGSSDISGGFSRIYRGICTGAVSTETVFSDQSFVKLYPNPASQQVFIEGVQEMALVEIWDLNGRKLLQKEVFNLMPWIDLSQVNKGKYIVKLTENGKTAGRMLVIE